MRAVRAQRSAKLVMALTVAVQMDPIERINIAGDFDLRAAARGAGARPSPALLHARPAFARTARASSRRRSRCSVRDVEGDHATLGEPQAVDLADVDVVLLRQDPPFDLAYITTTHLLERIHPADAGRQRSAVRARRARKAVRHGLSRADAADADLARPRGDRGVSRRARRSRHEAALRQRRRGGVQGRRARIRISARCSICSA